MEIASKEQIDKNSNILPPETKRAFLFLSEQNWLLGSEWYLAGGTALCLQSGHRKSVDLDFFSEQKNIDNNNSYYY